VIKEIRDTGKWAWMALNPKGGTLSKVGRLVILLAVIALYFLPMGCDSTPAEQSVPTQPPQPTAIPMATPVTIPTPTPVVACTMLATFDVQGERFTVFVTNPEVIAELTDDWTEGMNNKLPSGKLLRGAKDYNQPWNWYIDSEDIEMIYPEQGACNTTPSQIEANLDYYVDSIGRFCPSGAKFLFAYTTCE